MVFAELAEVEKRFEALEIETLRTSYIKSKPIYENRARLIKQIPGFWPTVLQSDHVPAAIESSIQSCDPQILNSLKAVEVARFEVDDDPEHGDPRNFKIVFEFDSGPFLEDKVLEKKFWYRRSNDGWAGLVSEPVRIRWKLNADPTLGLLDIAVDAYEERLKGSGMIGTSQGNKRSSTESSYDGVGAHSRLVNALEDSDAHSISLFAFFGYCGRNVTAEESAEAMMDQSPSRQDGSGNVAPEWKQSVSEGSIKSLIQNPSHLDSDDEDPLALEIFPAGEEVANALCEDIFPNALRYYAQASEQEVWQPGSESDLESGDVEDHDGHVSNSSSEVEERPRKRQR
ncbi:MAG: hypothetical protein Q9195_002099 [Heterodermia aff. obscurata]